MFFLLQRFSAYLRRGWEEIFKSEREGDIICAGCWIGSAFALGPILSLAPITVLLYPFILVGFVLNTTLVLELRDRVYFKVSPMRGFGIGLAGGFNGTLAITFLLIYFS